MENRHAQAPPLRRPRIFLLERTNALIALSTAFSPSIRENKNKKEEHGADNMKSLPPPKKRIYTYTGRVFGW